MEELTVVGPAIATAMARVQLEMQGSDAPNPTVLLETADALDDAVTKWQTIVTQTRLATDFQAREYAKFLQAHLQRHDQDVTQVAAGMLWQAACLRAVASGNPPPPPPADLDLAKLMASPQQQSMPAMMEASNSGVDAQPFDAAALDASPTIREEWNQLCADHEQLVVQMGANYGNFDPLGKLAFLDELAKVQDRWQ